MQTEYSGASRLKAAAGLSNADRVVQRHRQVARCVHEDRVQKDYQPGSASAGLLE
jgi:hypothetical protein